MDVSLCKLQEVVKDRVAWRAEVTLSQRVGRDQASEQQQWAAFHFPPVNHESKKKEHWV